MKKRIFLILFLIAAGVGVYLWHTGAFTHDGNRILVSGNLELTQVDLSFKTAGRIVERTVDEGAWVKKGDLIARLDPVQLQDQTSARPRLGVQRAIELRPTGDFHRISTGDARKRRRGAAGGAERMHRPSWTNC